MPLSDTTIRRAKPGIHPRHGPTTKPYRLADAGGLYLEVAPTGGKWWRWKYRFGGKEKRLSLGTYPETGLADARTKRDAARKLLATGVDPGEHRKEKKAADKVAAANSFEAVAHEWLMKQKPCWAEGHADKVARRLERDLFPWIGARPIAEITAQELLRHLERIEQRVVETAHRALQNCGQVFRYAVQTGRAERDPTGDLKGALTPWRPQNYAAATTPTAVASVLRKIDASTSGNIVRSALRLAPLLFSRPSELARMCWAELDMEAGQWRYVVSKTRREHVVALPSQALKSCAICTR